MNRNESIYLDLLRSLAALDVVFGHACDLYDLPLAGRWGHQAIMVFFVLSGYVIAYVTDKRENTFGLYLVARLSRLWSVLVPALLLTVACDVVGRQFGTDPRGFADAPADHAVVRVGAMLVFLSESWFSIQPLSNGAAWSLCLEFWYYVIFGLWMFMPRGWLRNAGMCAALLLLGHKGLLLFPIWLMGVSLHHSLALRRHPAWLDGVLWSISLVLMACILIGRVYDPLMGWMQAGMGPWVYRQLAQARLFWLDWIFGLLVATHLLAARTVAPWLPLERVERPIRWCAGVSFATYLFHFPLLHLTAAFLPANQGWLAIGLTLAVIAVIGPPAERSKKLWRNWLNGVSGAVTPVLERAARDRKGPQPL